MWANVTVNQQPASAVVDSGSIISILSGNIHARIGSPLSKSAADIYGVTGTKIDLIGETTVAVQIGHITKEVTVVVMDKLPHDMILGGDLLKMFKGTISYGTGQMFEVDGHMVEAFTTQSAAQRSDVAVTADGYTCLMTTWATIAWMLAIVMMLMVLAMVNGCTQTIRDGLRGSRDSKYTALWKVSQCQLPGPQATRSTRRVATHSTEGHITALQLVERKTDDDDGTDAMVRLPVDEGDAGPQDSRL